MPENFEKLLADYDYQFPQSAVALEPASPRDSAKLLICNRTKGSVRHDTFRHLSKYLPPKSLIVFNETKVVPARLIVTKPTGGRAEILYIGQQNGLIQVMADRRFQIGARLQLHGDVYFIVESQKEKYYFLRPSFPIKKLFSILEKYGQTPLPPYLRKTSLKGKALQEKYQTVFARERGSVAAPTASLHFTPHLLKDLQKSGHEIVFVTLHVNLGTFAPLTPEHVASGRLHEEYYEVPPQTASAIRRAKTQGRAVIAVGTTVARTLESAQFDKKSISGQTSLFILTGHRFHVVDGLITNFHVPKSSLLMLVAALVGREKLLELYSQAIAKKYRLFSFGDGMLIV